MGEATRNPRRRDEPAGAPTSTLAQSVEDVNAEVQRLTITFKEIVGLALSAGEPGQRGGTMHGGAVATLAGPGAPVADRRGFHRRSRKIKIRPFALWMSPAARSVRA